MNIPTKFRPDLSGGRFHRRRLKCQSIREMLLQPTDSNNVHSVMPIPQMTLWVRQSNNSMKIHRSILNIDHPQKRFLHKNNVSFVFIPSCLQEGSCLIYVICVCLHLAVTNTYCVVFLFCFSSSCVPYVASFSGLIVHFLLPLQCSLTFIYNLEHKARYLHFPTSGQIFHNSSHQDRYFIILHIRTDIL